MRKYLQHTFIWSVKPISSPKTSNILQQRSFTRVRSMGAAADESAHIPCIACKHVECASSLIVKRMVLCSPPRTNHQIELNEGFSTDDKRVWNVHHTFIISHTRNCLVTKNISLRYFLHEGLLLSNFNNQISCSRNSFSCMKMNIQILFFEQQLE